MIKQARTKKYYGNQGRYNYVIEAVCDCGKTFLIRETVYNESTGKCRSCRSKKHGLRKSPEYSVWSAMKDRCSNPKNKQYKDYGGRGISYAPAWENFETFVQDMGPRPEGFTLDRINNDGNYEPSNCRWSSWETQAYNRSNNRLLTYKGETKPVTIWCKELGLNYGTVKARLNRLGWTVEQAFETSTKNTGRAKW